MKVKLNYPNIYAGGVHGIILDHFGSRLFEKWLVKISCKVKWLNNVLLLYY